MQEKNNIQSVPAKPFLKWAGGKRQLLNHFIALYPPELKTGKIRNYYEPFAGSGAVFFDIVQRYQIEHAFLCDVNEDLVLTYKMIQAHVSELIGVLYKLEKEYLALNTAGRLSYFYEQRAAFNQQGFKPELNKHIDKGVKRAALLIFLNRTCFNGLFRVNSKGLFNTPAGDYKKPSVCDEENLRAASALLARATIKKADFAQVLTDVKPASFIYFDPPYRPLSTTAHFTAYNKSAFTDQQQEQLADIYRNASIKKALLLCSAILIPAMIFLTICTGVSISNVFRQNGLSMQTLQNGGLLMRL